MRQVLVSLVIILICWSCQDLVETTIVDELYAIESEFDVELEVDESITSSNAIVFDDLNDLKSFIDSVQLSLDSGIVDQLDDAPDADIEERFYCRCDNNAPEGRIDGEYQASIFTRLNFSFRILNGQISASVGYFSGWTLATSYTLQSSTLTKNCNTYEITTTGTYNYNIITQGIGTIYRQRVRHKITIPCGGGIVNVSYYER